MLSCSFADVLSPHCGAAITKSTPKLRYCCDVLTPTCTLPAAGEIALKLSREARYLLPDVTVIGSTRHASNDYVGPHSYPSGTWMCRQAHLSGYRAAAPVAGSLQHIQNSLAMKVPSTSRFVRCVAIVPYCLRTCGLWLPGTPDSSVAFVESVTNDDRSVMTYTVEGAVLDPKPHYWNSPECGR